MPYQYALKVGCCYEFNQVVKDIQYLNLNSVYYEQYLYIIQDFCNHIQHLSNKAYFHLNFLEVIMIYLHYYG